MCGISCSVSRKGFIEPSQEAIHLLQQRGPDSLRMINRECIGSGDATPAAFVSLQASVLSLRGDKIVPQPLCDVPLESPVFCWNGEAWLLVASHIHGNDTTAVYDLMKRATSGWVGTQTAEDNMVVLLTQMRGPYAFVLYHQVDKKLYYARDCLGRRSLVQTTDAAGNLHIASIPDLQVNNQWSEVGADGLYIVDLARMSSVSTEHEPFVTRHVPYVFSDESLSSRQLVFPYPRLNKELPTEDCPVLGLQSEVVQQLDSKLRQSLQLRVCDIRPSSHAGTKVNVAILFSGGLDCTLLARITHDLLPPGEPIDLLNVAFQNPRIHGKVTTSPYELCPDRQTGRASFIELQRTCPGRRFRLICINVPYTETEAHQQQVIELIHPHNTEMDFSIACALYFASRGIGEDSETGTYAATSARVLLSGLGADELFGGYQRHATAFARSWFGGLLEELDLDISRLGKRNLGRDDRVLSHWGREARYPYLDEDFVAWTLAAPVWLKMGFRHESTSATQSDQDTPDLDPEKLILRLLAWQYGLRGAAKEKKRAIQFGARTAKMHSGRTKGTTLLS